MPRPATFTGYLLPIAHYHCQLKFFSQKSSQLGPLVWNLLKQTVNALVNFHNLVHHFTIKYETGKYVLYIICSKSSFNVNNNVSETFREMTYNETNFTTGYWIQTRAKFPGHLINIAQTTLNKMTSSSSDSPFPSDPLVITILFSVSMKVIFLFFGVLGFFCIFCPFVAFWFISQM